jgi:hypothetical protein
MAMVVIQNGLCREMMVIPSHLTMRTLMASRPRPLPSGSPAFPPVTWPDWQGTFFGGFRLDYGSALSRQCGLISTSDDFTGSARPGRGVEVVMPRRHDLILLAVPAIMLGLIGDGSPSQKAPENGAVVRFTLGLLLELGRLGIRP